MIYPIQYTHGIYINKFKFAYNIIFRIKKDNVNKNKVKNDFELKLLKQKNDREYILQIIE